MARIHYTTSSPLLSTRPTRKTTPSGVVFHYVSVELQGFLPTLHQSDIQVSVPLAQLVNELLFLLFVLHDDAVVQLQKSAVILGLDAVEVAVTAILFHHGLENSVVVQGLGNQDAKTFACAAKAVKADDGQEKNSQKDHAHGNSAEADEANAAGICGQEGEIVEIG